MRKAIEKGAIAVVVARDRAGDPGQGMYYQESGDQRDLNIPVIEIYQVVRSSAHALINAVGPDGIEVSIWPQENQWKKANDNIIFQIVLNVILSGMEVAILVLGILRINRWSSPSCSRLSSIGPVCIMLEMVGALLRLIETVVDPFFTFRIYPATFGLILLTSSFPFLLTSGILLTFFWAETLKASRVQASPFIAEYKKSAAIVVFALFAGEIAASVTRVVLPVTGKFNPAYISQGFYVITCVILVVCYLLCAHEITKRISSGKFSKRKRYIRNMNIRFAVSTSGYIIFILSTIASIILVTYPWGWKIVFNLMFFGLNIAGLLQVYSLKPAGTQKSSRGRGSSGTIEASNSHPHYEAPSQS